MDSKKIGTTGERIAVKYLEKKGYQILDRNYSTRFISGPQKGEIDIIAKPSWNIFDILRGKKDNTIHFIEVKTLSKNNTGSTFAFFPEQKVDWQKQRKIIRTAERWLNEKKIPLNSKWQLDVIAIEIDPDLKKVKIRYFQNIRI